MRSMIRACAFASSLAISAALLAGCGKHAQDILKEVQARKSAPVDPFGTDAIATAARELEAQLGSPVRALDVEISKQRIVFEVQDPKKPANVDAYELRNGVLLAPHPVQLMGDGDLEANLFDLAELPLDRIPELTKAALTAIQLEDAKVGSLRIHRRFSGVPDHVQKLIDESNRRIGIAPEKLEMPNGAIALEMYVDSPRRRGYVLADERFEIIRTSLL